MEVSEYRTIYSRIAGMIGHDVTGWDMGCRTLEFYVNNLAKEGTRKEGEWPTRKGKAGGRVTLSGQRKSPLGLPRGLWWVGGLVTGERGENEQQSEKEAES